MALADLQRKLTIATAGLSEPEIKQKLVRFAMSTLGEMIEAGSGSPDYTRYVNGRAGAPESSVKLPGPILYEFHWLEDVAVYALAFLKARWTAIGPGRGGHFRDAYFVMGGGKEIPVEDASKYDEITIVNDKPYARKAQIGYKGFLVPRGLFEDCRQAIMRKFGKRLLKVELKFINLAGGYILKGGRKRTDRKGRSRGQEMRYPAVVVSTRM